MTQDATPASDNIVTVAAIGLLAYVSADLAHHALGHGGACLALGGRVVSLTSVHVTCTLTGSAVDVAGPLANLAVGLLALIAAQALRWAPAGARLFLVLTAAFNLFWLEAELVFSALSMTDDWAYLIASTLRPAPVWRVGAAGIGAGAYWLTYRWTAAAMRAFASDDAASPARRVRTMTTTAWLVAGAAAIVTALRDPGGGHAISRHAAPQALVTAIGLLFVPGGAARFGPPAEAAPRIGVGLGWIAAAAAALVLSIVFLGPGFALG